MESDREDNLHALERVDAVTSPYLESTADEGWYHAALGAASGLVIAAQGFPTPWAAYVSLGFVLTIPLFIGWWRRSHGWWVSGYAPGRTVWASALMLLALIGMGATSFFADALWVSLVAGSVAAAVVTASGFWWMHLWRGGMRRQATA